MSNNNEIFMTENKSNKASIIVAILAICLILGGVYLLNQSFNSSSKTTETAKTATPKTETKAPTATSSTATPTTSDSVTTPTTSATPTTTNGSQVSTTPTTVTTTPTTSTVATSPVTPPATVAKPVLTEKQIIAKALSVSSTGEVKFEIQECGLLNAKVCKAGTKFSLTGVKATAGKVYLVSGNISESNGTLSLENITIKENT